MNKVKIINYAAAILLMAVSINSVEAAPRKKELKARVKTASWENIGLTKDNAQGSINKSCQSRLKVFTKKFFNEINFAQYEMYLDASSSIFVTYGASTVDNQPAIDLFGKISIPLSFENFTRMREAEMVGPMYPEDIAGGAASDDLIRRSELRLELSVMAYDVDPSKDKVTVRAVGNWAVRGLNYSNGEYYSADVLSEKSSDITLQQLCF
jgi:hypothetical protein